MCRYIMAGKKPGTMTTTTYLTAAMIHALVPLVQHKHRVRLVRRWLETIVWRRCDYCGSWLKGVLTTAVRIVTLKSR